MHKQPTGRLSYSLLLASVVLSFSLTACQTNPLKEQAREEKVAPNTAFEAFVAQFPALKRPITTEPPTPRYCFRLAQW
jgi:hypothetical protein